MYGRSLTDSAPSGTLKNKESALNKESVMTKDELKKHLSESYHHTAERIFKKKFPEIYSEINDLEFPSDFCFQQKLYHYMNDDIGLNLGLCPVCRNRCGFISYKSGYHKYCSRKCSGMDTDTKEHRRKTNIKLYGVENIGQLKKDPNKIIAKPFDAYLSEYKIKKQAIQKYLIDHPGYLHEKNFKNKFNCDYIELLKIPFPDSFIFTQKIYHYLNDDVSLNLGTCPVCGKRCRLKSFNHGYYTHCSAKCASNSDNVRKRRAKTNMIKYGNVCSLHGEEIDKKTKNTKQLKYGDKNYNNREKYKITNLTKIGVEYPLQSREIMDKLEQTNIEKYGVKQIFSLKETHEKAKRTNMINRGVPYPAQDPAVIEKAKETNKENLGVDWPMQSEDVKEKSRQTCLEKYGVEHPAQAEITKLHVKQTNLEKYGVEWYCMIASKKSGRGSNSKPNLDFAAKLDSLDIPYEREFSLSRYVYDFKINDILVEINPSITHNCSVNIFGGEPKPADYHLDKSRIAWDAGYRCVHVWDWDDTDRIVCYLSNAVKEKPVISIDVCEIKEVSEPDARVFIYENSLFPVTDGQKYSGLFYDDNLIQVVSYRIGDNIGITSLCSNCNVTRGYSGIIGYISDIYAGKRVGATVDLSKYPAGLYKDIFAKSSCSDPEFHGYRPYDGMHIFDIQNISDIPDGFLPVRDCGYETYVL